MGNGFDLSHYLPTKYDHFMVAMGAIENWDVSKGDMNFDDLFGSLYEKEDYFFGYTKAMYKTDEIKISVEQIKELQKQLKENVWYQYFSDHVREVKTWIDFEQKIGQALKGVSELFDQISKFYLNRNKLNTEIMEIEGKKTKTSGEAIFLNEKSSQILFILRLVEKKYYELLIDKAGNRSRVETKNKTDLFKYFICETHISNLVDYNSYNDEEVIKILYKSLNNLIEIFNYYLIVVEKLNLIKNLKETPLEVNKIYSFNYTNTFGRLTGFNEVVFLHGKAGEKQSIVMGISDLKDENLIELKAYGFTKYHQKIMKQISFKFLSDNKDIKLMIDSFWSKGKALSKKIRIENQIVINIWGHSLDQSDESYIKEIFSFNVKKDENIRVIIYYFDESSKLSIISNLLAILGKEKIEKWVREDWLTFKPNPDIAKINNIAPVDLTKAISIVA